MSEERLDKRTAKREALKDALIAVAAKRIERDGLTGFRARDVAADAGCALGSIYNVFEDLDALILAVNLRTLSRLGEALGIATAGLEGKAALKSLAAAYLAFARDNQPAWSALFDHQMAGDAPLPDWFLGSPTGLLDQVQHHLALVIGTDDRGKLDLKSRTYFTAVHGIVAMGLQGRLLGVPTDQLPNALNDFTDELLAGLSP
ncbi:MAG: TetR/AcrR family transcriptional regulator [Pseudomonadota bacterium]